MPVGRPTAYMPEYAEQARKLCLLGAIDKELADFFGVSEQTINAWKHEFPEFLEALKKGKEQADANVADRLYQRAMGYEHPETKVFCSEGDIVTHDMTKYYPPDTAACLAWLSNRTRKRSSVWKTKFDQSDITSGGEPLQAPVIVRPEKSDQ